MYKRAKTHRAVTGGQGSPHMLFGFTATLVLLVTICKLTNQPAQPHGGLAAATGSTPSTTDKPASSFMIKAVTQTQAPMLASIPSVLVATGRISSCFLPHNRLAGLNSPVSTSKNPISAVNSMHLTDATAVLQLRCVYSLGRDGGGSGSSLEGSWAAAPQQGRLKHQQMQQQITVIGLDRLTCSVHAEGPSSSMGSCAQPAGDRHPPGKQTLQQIQHYVFLLHRTEDQHENKVPDSTGSYRLVEYAPLPAHDSTGGADVVPSLFEEWGEAVHLVGCFDTASAHPAAPVHHSQLQQPLLQQQHLAAFGSPSSAVEPTAAHRQLLQSAPAPAPSPVPSPYPSPAESAGPDAAAATASVVTLALWDQCGGTSNCASNSPCADKPWSSASGCPAGSSCDRRDATYWQCRATAAAPQNSTTEGTAAPLVSLSPIPGPRNSTAAESPLKTSDNISVPANGTAASRAAAAMNGTSQQQQQQPAVRAADGPLSRSSSGNSSQKNQAKDKKDDQRRGTEPAVVLLDESGKSTLGSGSANASLAATQLLCALQPEVGPCRASIPRWAFMVQRVRCESFTWGGCNGNDNNFATKELCAATCGEAVVAGPWTSSNSSSSASNSSSSSSSTDSGNGGGRAVDVPLAAVTLPDRVLIDSTTGRPGGAGGVTSSGSPGQGSRQGLGFTGLAVLSAAVLMLV